MTTEEVSTPVAPIQPLPSLPHPSGLLGTSSTAYLTLNESRQGRESLDKFKQTLLDGGAGYNLDPPGPSHLPPLPSIPIPPKRHSKPSTSLPSKTPRPISRPRIPDESPFANASTVGDCIDAYGSSSVVVQNATLLVDLSSYGSAWIFLKQLPGPGDESKLQVECVKLYTGSDPNPPPLHSFSIEPPRRALGRSLTNLRLSLPELLWRLKALQEIADHPCLFCNRRLHPHDGIPIQTGWIPPQHESGTGSPSEVQDIKMEGDGKWVHWHPSCQPA